MQTLVSLRFCFVIFVLLSAANALVSQQQVTSFSRLLDGEVSQNGDPEYEETVSVYNGDVHETPLFVVYPKNHHDIQLTILFAILFDLPLTVKGGGHSAAGYSLNSEGVVIDMSSMANITLSSDGTKITLGGGATWRQAYEYLGGTNKLAIGGDCSSVGAGGYTQGGGFSILSRSYGMAADQLISVSLVTALGLYVTVGIDSTSQIEKDLFWAIRGGGGGNWGVITEFTFKVYEAVTPKFLTAQFCYPLPLATPVYTFFSSYIIAAPDNLTMYSQMTKLGGQYLYCIGAFYNGPWSSGFQYIAPFLTYSPIVANMQNSTYLDYSNYIKTTETLFGTEGKNAYVKSGFLPNTTTAENITSVYNYVKSAILSSTNNQTIFLFYHLGGKIARTSHDATSFAHRSKRFSYELRSTWDTAATKSAAINLAQTLSTTLSPFTRGAYVNQIDPLLPNWQNEYYGSHYNKLKLVKQIWDPFNFFSFQQSVGSTYSP